MKKIIISILYILTITSCVSIDDNINNLGNENNIYIKSTPIRKNNKISGLFVKGTLDLVNNEINRYLIEYFYNYGNSKIKMDILPEYAVSDAIFIKNIYDSNLVFDFKVLGKHKTINKDILFLITSKNSNITVSLDKDLILDETSFRINKFSDENYNYYYLKPIFINELAFDEKVKTNYIENIDPVAFNKELAITQYDFEEDINNNKYSTYVSKLENNRVYFRDITLPNSDIKIKVENKGVIKTKSDEKGVYATYIPIKKGSIDIQINNENTEIIKKIKVGN